MDDRFAGLTEQEIADVCMFADCTLPEARQAEVEAWVAASPQRIELLERQRYALAATQALAAEPVPASLGQTVAALAPRERPRRRRRLAFSLSAIGVVAAVLVVFLVLSLGGTGGPSVAAAADLALQPPNGPAPATVAGTDFLAAGVGGVSFPDLAAAYGWQPVGQRHGEVAGRPATVVYYEKDGRRVGYAIVDGPALPRPGNATATSRRGVEYLTLAHQGRQVVTWQNQGHTCVMVGPVAPQELIELASWPGAAQGSS